MNNPKVIGALFGKPEICIEAPEEFSFEIGNWFHYNVCRTITLHGVDTDSISLALPATRRGENLVRRNLRRYKFTVEEVTDPTWDNPHLLFRIIRKKKWFFF